MKIRQSERIANARSENEPDPERYRSNTRNYRRDYPIQREPRSNRQGRASAQLLVSLLSQVYFHGFDFTQFSLILDFQYLRSCKALNNLAQYDELDHI